MLEEWTGASTTPERRASSRPGIELGPRGERLPAGLATRRNTRIWASARAAESLRCQGFTIVAGRSFRFSSRQEAHWRALREAWSTLPVDPYIKATRPYRFRRYAAWRFTGTTRRLSLQQRRLYYQSPDVNPLFGGIPRRFAPLDDRLARNPALLSLINYDLDLVQRSTRAPLADWDIDAHLVRITASDDAPGEPSPEGIHRDGLDFAAIHLIGSKDVDCGTTTVYADTHAEVAAVVLQDPLDLLLINDRLLLHFTAPISLRRDSPATAALRHHVGWRDVLLVGLTVGNRRARRRGSCGRDAVSNP